MSVAAVVLAAGFSRRLGRPKQSVEWDGEALLERAVRVALEAGFAPVIAVVADSEWIVRLRLADVVVVLNTKASEGMSSSIRGGIATAQEWGATGAIVMACDQVALTATHLRLLVQDPENIIASAYAGRVGVPAYFPSAMFEKLMSLEGDIGARELLRGVESVRDESLALDIDTEEDLARARELLA